MEQVRTLVAAIAGDRLEALYLVALGVGLRQGEILGLRWSDVDLEGGTLKVRHALARIDGRLELVEPKSVTSRRVVPLPAFVRDALMTPEPDSERPRAPWERGSTLCATTPRWGGARDPSSANRVDGCYAIRKGMEG